VAGEYGFESQILQLVGKLGHFHRPFARELLRAPFKLSITMPLRQAEYWMNLHSAGKPHHLSPADRTKLFARHVSLVITLCQHLLLAEPETFPGFLRSHRLLYLPSLKRVAGYFSALSLPEDDGLDLAVQEISVRDVGLMVSAFLGIVEPPDLDLGEGARQFGLSGVSTEVTDPEHAYNMILVVRRGGCWNMCCPSSSDSTVPSRFCSKCNIVRYCGQTVRTFIFSRVFCLLIPSILPILYQSQSAKEKLGTIQKYLTNHFVRRYVP
jgi:hypothetical protein